LAAALFLSTAGYHDPAIRFQSKSGWLTVTPQSNDSFTLDFPADPPQLVSEIPEGLFEGLGIESRPVYKGNSTIWFVR
jgi:hypothetical protein